MRTFSVMAISPFLSIYQVFRMSYARYTPRLLEVDLHLVDTVVSRELMFRFVQVRHGLLLVGSLET